MARDTLTGTRIRERRMLKGLRQAEVARMAGISGPYLNLIEHNRRRIGGALLNRIAEALDVPISFFFEGLEENERKDAASASVPADLMGDKEALDLVRSYYSIPENQRRRLFELARVLSDVA